MKIRYYSHIGRITGYGRAAADLCMALLSTGQIDLEIVPIGRAALAEASVALERYQPLRACLRNDDELSPPDVCIVHTLPLDCVKVMDHAQSGQQGHAGFAGFTALDPEIPWVAYTTWEGCGTAPDQVLQALASFEQVWTPSYASSRALGPIVDIQRSRDGSSAWSRHKIIPHAFDPATLEERRRTRAERVAIDRGGVPYRFYYSGAWTSRKNPAGILRAWGRAFTKNDHVELVLHSPGASQEAYVVAMHQTGLYAQDMAPVLFDSQSLSEADYWALHHQGDCFVTATRGEAWNLPAFDALLAGRHVIHPCGMGADDFLENTSAAMYGGMWAPASVDVAITERMANGVKMSMVGAQGLSSRSTWLEPNLTTLSDLMRAAARDLNCDLKVDYDLAARYGYSAVGRTALSALEEL